MKHVFCNTRSRSLARSAAGFGAFSSGKRAEFVCCR